MMTEAILNAYAQRLHDMTLCKSREDPWDLEWYTEGPFWRRTDMRYSREYKIIPDYEIADAKHGMSLGDIAVESARLESDLRSYRAQARPDELPRTDYLIEHVHNLNVRTRMLLGEKMSFDQMSQGLYGLTAPAYDYSRFDAIMEDLDAALPGSGSAREKALAFREKIAIPRESLLTVLKGTTQAFHDLSVQNMEITGNSMPRVRVRELPSKSMVFLSILFGYDYNHLEYERNFNLLYPWTVDRVMDYIGHEMEPGHLTFFEKRLETMIDTCWPEMGIVSQYSSSSAFTEGSARYAISMCFGHSTEQQLDFERELIFKPAGLDTGLVELMPLWHRFCEISGYGKLEATRNMHDGKWNCEQAFDFLNGYAFLDRDATQEDVRALLDDPAHFVAHDYARDTVKAYFETVAPDVRDQWPLYEKLCRSHVTMQGILNKSFVPTV